MEQETILSYPLTTDAGYLKDGIYVLTEKDLGIEGIKSYYKIIDNKTAWMMTFVGNKLPKFMFVVRESNDKIHTQINTVCESNESMIVKFSSLIAEHYPEDVDSVLKLQSELAI
tara:strand:- start:482 stop:823 length:342 start_codon:yes stop_codon:yes gene_type:complete